MNDLAVWYLISHAVNPPWANIFQSSMSMVDIDASSMKITSVDFVSIALLKTLCLVIVATLEWWMSPRMGWKRLVLPLLASLIRQGTLSLWRLVAREDGFFYGFSRKCFVRHY